MARPLGSPKFGGRAPGTPNKATEKTRQAIASIAEDMGDKFKEWILRTATGDEEVGLKPDPKGAADLYLKAIEYHIPKLARSEITGLDGKDFLPPAITITGYEDTSPPKAK